MNGNSRGMSQISEPNSYEEKDEFCDLKLNVELLIRISGISATRGGGCARRELGRALKTSSSRKHDDETRLLFLD